MRVLLHAFLLLGLFPFAVTSLVMTGPAALNVKFVLKPEQSKSAFLSALRKDQEQTLATEPGALQFVIGQDKDDSNTIHLHEQYKTKADLEHHRSTPHFAEFNEYCQDVFAQDPVIDSFQCQHVPFKILPRTAFCLNVESCIKPEFRDEFMELMASHQKNSLSEPLCLQFDWGESLDTPNSFYIHEEYQTVDGYNAHETTPHFDKFMTFNPFFTSSVKKFARKSPKIPLWRQRTKNKFYSCEALMPFPPLKITCDHTSQHAGPTMGHCGQSCCPLRSASISSTGRSLFGARDEDNAQDLDGRASCSD